MADTSQIVFISWSGERSKAVAAALRDWLPLVVQQCEPWMSDRDLQAGDEWDNEIQQHLDAARVGIICLTPENLEKPWLHFEAGAIAKTVEAPTRVCPYLHDLSKASVKPPLARFQLVQSDEKGTAEIVETVNAAMPRPIGDAVLARVFVQAWPELERTLDAIPKPAKDGAAAVKRNDRELLEEILENIRAIRSPAGMEWATSPLLRQGLPTGDTPLANQLRVLLGTNIGSITRALLQLEMEQREKAEALRRALDSLPDRTGDDPIAPPK